jgi:hypothetical protein
VVRLQGFDVPPRLEGEVAVFVQLTNLGHYFDDVAEDEGSWLQTCDVLRARAPSSETS